MNGLNGKRNQYIGIGTAILLAGGGGGLLGANTHRHPEVKENEHRIDLVETDIAVICEKLNHIDEKLDKASENVDDILKILRDRE